MCLWLTLALLDLLVCSIITTQGVPSIDLSSSVDVTSGGDVCPEISVEFSCTATEVAFLNWFRNGRRIGGFNSADNPGTTVNATPYSFFLDSVNVVRSPLANFTSRLVVELSIVMSGNNISCSQLDLGSSNILSYRIRDPPPVLTANDYSISFATGERAVAKMSFNFTWDSTFNSRHAITSYRVVPVVHQGMFVLECPSSCSPHLPCQCIGLPIGEQVTVNISAINCDDQEGPITMVTVASSCEAGDLGEEVDNVTNSRCTTLSSVSLTNGIGCFSSVATGSVATYQCDEGYSLSGDSQRTCRSNGRWNGNVPQCEVLITDANKGFLAFSVVLWILSVVLTIIGPVTMAVRKVSFTWQHQVYYILLVIEVLILVVVIILWGVFGAAVGNPNRTARAIQNSSIIAALALSLTAVIWIIAAVVFVHIKKNPDTNSGMKEVQNADVHTHDPTPFNVRTDLTEEMYDQLCRNPNVTATFIEDTQPPGYGHLESKDKQEVEDNDQAKSAEISLL